MEPWRRKDELAAATSLTPSAELAIADHDSVGAPVPIQVAPKSVEIRIEPTPQESDEQGAAILEPSAETVTAVAYMIASLPVVLTVHSWARTGCGLANKPTRMTRTAIGDFAEGVVVCISFTQ